MALVRLKSVIGAFCGCDLVKVGLPFHPGIPVDVKTRLGSYLVLASTDLIAADATAARVMSQDEWKIQEVMNAARDNGLGNMTRFVRTKTAPS